MKLRKIILGLGVMALLSMSMSHCVTATAPSYLQLKIEGATDSIVCAIGDKPRIIGQLSITNQSYDYLFGIAGRVVYIQQKQADGSWLTVYSQKSFTDPPNPQFSSQGEIVVEMTMQAPGTFIYRLAFAGDDQYAPCVSNEVTVIVNTSSFS